MIVRDLERMLVPLGVAASASDTVTRTLREGSKLPIGGRGTGAPRIGPAEASAVLAAIAGADVARQASAALARQIELRLPAGAPFRHAPEFLDALQVILGNTGWAGDVAEVRVGRSVPLSQIVYKDGVIERFVRPGLTLDEAATLGGGMFRSEGVLSGGLLAQVAYKLASSEPARHDQSEEVE